MKPLVCEMCGSSDLVKMDGLFQCQHCGTKYSVEEAKKMMFEGVVKIDNSERNQNLYILARRARDEGNSTRAAQYYEQLLLEDPNDWEASLYSVTMAAIDMTVGEIVRAADSVYECLSTVFAIFVNNRPDEDEEEAILSEIQAHILDIGDMMYESAKENVGYFPKDFAMHQEFMYQANAVTKMVLAVGDCLEYVFPESGVACALAVDAWKMGMNIHYDARKTLKIKPQKDDTVIEYVTRISEYDPGYKGDYKVSGWDKKAFLKKRR